MTTQPLTIDELLECYTSEADLQLAEFAPLREAIEQDPSLLEQLERIGSQDSLIRSHLQTDFAIPTGLEERLLHTVDLQPRRFTLKTVVAAASIATVAALLLVAALLQNGGEPSSEPITKSQIAQHFGSLYRQLDSQEPTFWQNVSEPVLPEAIILSPKRWSSSLPPSNLGSTTVAIDLAGDGSSILFILSTTREIELPEYPYTTLPASGQIQIGAWRQDGTLYVVITTSDRPLPQIIRPPTVA